MSLSATDVEWVAHLARLQLSESERSTMAAQLSAILDYVATLHAVNTDNVEPMAHALDVRDVFRDDAPAASLPVESAVANAPSRRNDYFGVPAVLE